MFTSGEGVLWGLFVSETAQVDLRKWTSVSPWLEAASAELAAAVERSTVGSLADDACHVVIHI